MNPVKTPTLPDADLEHILAHTRGLWEPMRGQNVFVTGGTGFFGRWLLESFAFVNERLALRAHMTVLTRDPSAIAARAPALAAYGGIRFVSGDVRYLTPARILTQLPPGHTGQFPYLIHAATESVGQEDPIATFDTIVTGARAALDFAVASGTTRFLFTSSGAVYGPQPSDMTHIPETWQGAPDCTRPASAYGEGKRAAELLCASYHARTPPLQPVIARCFAFVGPFLPLDAHFAIGNFIRDALRGGPIAIGGDGTPYRSYLYAADLAIWLWTLLFRGHPIRPYNVGSEHDLTILDVAQVVADRFPNKIEIKVARQPAPGAAPSRYVPATRFAQSGLSLQPWIDLPDAVRRTIEWHSRVQ